MSRKQALTTPIFVQLGLHPQLLCLSHPSACASLLAPEGTDVSMFNHRVCPHARPTRTQEPDSVHAVPLTRAVHHVPCPMLFHQGGMYQCYWNYQFLLHAHYRRTIEHGPATFEAPPMFKSFRGEPSHMFRRERLSGSAVGAFRRDNTYS